MPKTKAVIIANNVPWIAGDVVHHVYGPARLAISEEQRVRVGRFFRDLETPIDAAREGIVYNDARQYRAIAPLCLIYGAVVSLGVAVPNPLAGRLCFLFVGGVMLAVGLLMRAAGRRAAAAEANLSAHSP